MSRGSSCILVPVLSIVCVAMLLQEVYRVAVASHLGMRHGDGAQAQCKFTKVKFYVKRVGKQI